MKLLTWVSIYCRIDNRMWEIKLERGLSGIAIMRDPAALEYQRLEHIQRHVGCHLFAQRDRERGMKSARCYYSDGTRPAEYRRRLERTP